MKTSSSIILMMACLMAGCEKIALETMSVKKYVSLLKSGSYDYIELPPFDSEDIPELLKYADDDLLIRNYPVNPISSLSGGDCKLGVFILWTVESVRVCSINADGHPFRFPSLNPILAFKDPGSGVFEDEKAHQAAVKAYRDWWNSNSDYQIIKNTDPLDTTLYRWR